MFAARIFSTTMIRSSLVAFFTLAASSLATKPAEAAFDMLTTVNTGSAEVVSISYNGKSESVYAVAFQSKLFNIDGTPASGTFNSYCVDIPDELTGKERVDVKAITTLGGGYGSNVGSLYANFAAGATSFVDQAALQLAIWKTEYDGPNATSNTGHFVVNSASQAVLDQAVFYYTHNTLVPTDGVSYLQVEPGTPGQSLVGPAAVPEPASMVMLGMGLAAGVGCSVRRRLRSTVA